MSSSNLILNIINYIYKAVSPFLSVLQLNWRLLCQKARWMPTLQRLTGNRSLLNHQRVLSDHYLMSIMTMTQKKQMQPQVTIINFPQTNHSLILVLVAILTVVIVLFFVLLFSTIFILAISLPSGHQGRLITHGLCRQIPAWAFIANSSDSWCDERIFMRPFDRDYQCPCFSPSHRPTQPEPLWPYTGVYVNH